MSQVTDAIELLASREATMSCAELVALLEGLEFAVRRRASGNHHTLLHPGLPDFLGASFDGGHGKSVKSIYVREMKKLIHRYGSELTAYLNGEDRE